MVKLCAASLKHHVVSLVLSCFFLWEYKTPCVREDLRNRARRKTSLLCFLFQLYGRVYYWILETKQALTLYTDKICTMIILTWQNDASEDIFICLFDLTIYSLSSQHCRMPRQSILQDRNQSPSLSYLVSSQKVTKVRSSCLSALNLSEVMERGITFIESLMSSYAESKRVTKQCSFTTMNWFAFKNTHLHLIILKTVQRNLEIAQWLLCKHEYLSSIPRMHIKSQAWWCMFAIRKVGR